MRRAEVHFKGESAGILEELDKGGGYRFQYHENYKGDPVSLTMPVKESSFVFDEFPAFFDGLLPEGMMLDGLLKKRKIDRDDLFGQLVAVGKDLVGAVTVVEISK